MDCGRRDKRGGLSAKTVRYIHTIIHKALADAERKGAVIRNVAPLSEPPKLTSAGKPEMRVWTGEQLRSFLRHAEGHAFYPAFFLAAHTGMRRGEVLGLRWKDVDLSRSRLSVRQAIVSVAHEVGVSDVKTGSARRTIDLDPRTLAVLRSWRKRQLEERLLVGVGGSYEGLAFARPDGRPIHPDFFSQCFDRLEAQTDLPRIRPHDLRHTHATLLLQAGQPPKVVSERLGHSTPGFTLTVYQHVIPGMQAEAASAFSELVFGSDQG
jgi:integrase